MKKSIILIAGLLCIFLMTQAQVAMDSIRLGDQSNISLPIDSLKSDFVSVRKLNNSIYGEVGLGSVDRSIGGFGLSLGINLQVYKQVFFSGNFDTSVPIWLDNLESYYVNNARTFSIGYICQYNFGVSYISIGYSDLQIKHVVKQGKDQKFGK